MLEKVNIIWFNDDSYPTGSLGCPNYLIPNSDKVNCWVFNKSHEYFSKICQIYLCNLLVYRSFTSHAHCFISLLNETWSFIVPRRVLTAIIMNIMIKLNSVVSIWSLYILLTVIYWWKRSLQICQQKQNVLEFSGQHLCWNLKLASVCSSVSAHLFIILSLIIVKKDDPMNTSALTELLQKTQDENKNLQSYNGFFKIDSRYNIIKEKKQ